MNLDEFLPYVLPKAKGCPDPVAIFEVRLAIIEFCSRTLIWREYQPGIETIALQTYYAYTPAAGQQMSKLLSLTLEGVDVPVVNPQVGAGFDMQNEQSTYAYGGLRTFSLMPAQAADLTIVTYSAVAPSITAATIPDEFARYMEQIARGALARLLTTSGRDYSDPPLGKAMRNMFEDDIGDAKDGALKGLARTTVRTSPVWF